MVITGHYDTKSMPGRHFVGANDGGSSTGFLLEMAKVLAGEPHKDDVYLVWFDGEEAVGAMDRDGQPVRQPPSGRAMGGGRHAGAHQGADQRRHDRRPQSGHSARTGTPPRRCASWFGRPRTGSGYGKHFLRNQRRHRRRPHAVSAARRERARPDRLRLRPGQCVLAHRQRHDGQAQRGRVSRSWAACCWKR